MEEVPCFPGEWLWMVLASLEGLGYWELAALCKQLRQARLGQKLGSFPTLCLFPITIFQEMV